jgi:hypothetical protein
MRQRTVDFNSVLKGLNLLVACGTLLVSRELDANPYVNSGTIVLATLLCLQTHVALTLERRRRDPFILLLAFSMIFYYSLRIITLTLYPFSAVFERFPYSPADSNYALFFIFVANVFLYSGFYLVRSETDLTVRLDGWKATSPARVVALLIAAIAFGYLSEGFWTEETIPRALDFLAIFFTPEIIVLLVLAYLLVYRRSLGRGFALTVAILLAVEMTMHTLVGSRSAVVGFIYSCLFVGLALRGSVAVKRKTLVLGVLLLPILVAVLVASFAISTFNRVTKESGSVLNLRSGFELASQLDQQPIDLSLDLVLPPIFARAGFFDFSAEVIAHRAQYQSVINPAAYAKSIIDNVLTPGFDVFDYPKIGNALQFVYLGWGTPQKTQVTLYYQSDQLGVYGEFYGLFGWVSLPLLFVLAVIFKRVYVGLQSSNPYRLVAKRAVMLFIFKKLVDSFGIDWIILDTLPLVSAIVLYSWFFSAKRIAAPPRNSPSGGELPGYATL